MDSAVQLALMSKAKKVFGADDTFLSFPVSPLPHTKRQLDFFAQQDADALRQSLQNLQAFSTLVNLIPSDEAWLPTETRFLWDVYEQVLKEATVRILVSHSRGGSGVSAGPRLPARSRRGRRVGGQRAGQGLQTA